MSSKAYEYYFKLSAPVSSCKDDPNEKDAVQLKRVLTARSKLLLAMSVTIIIIGIASVVLFLTLLPPNEATKEEYWMPDYVSNSRLGKYKSAAVSTGAAPCAAIGKDILARNGSVIDAAIACLVCMGAVNPQSSGLGGGFLMLFYNKTRGRPIYLDARDVAPSAATQDMYAGNISLSKIGGLSIAVPGELFGSWMAHLKYGRLPWEDLFLPTIKLCREGIVVTRHLAEALEQRKEKMQNYPALRNLFTNPLTNQLYKKNDVMKRLDLADTLEQIIKLKAEALHNPDKSPLALSYLNDMKSAGSIITQADLQFYMPKGRKVVKLPLRNNMTLYSISPPGSGGLLAFILGVIDGYSDINENTTRSEKLAIRMLHRIIEAFKFAYAHRMHMEDSFSKEMNELMKNLTSKDYIDNFRNKIMDDGVYEEVENYGENVYIQEDHGTAHLSIVGPNGDAVVVTSSINLYFGSMVLSPTTGIILNNAMDDFSSPNITNSFGVPPTAKNHIMPLKRPLSSMSPTIILDANGDVRLAIGANGGTQITSSVAQVIIRNLILGDNIKKSIDGPRFHHQLVPNYIQYENCFRDSILEELKKKGHKLEDKPTKMIGVVMAIARETDGYLYANADFRKEGDVDGF